MHNRADFNLPPVAANNIREKLDFSEFFMSYDDRVCGSKCIEKIIEPQ